MRRLAVALVHHPVLDRQRAIVTTAITNLDLHDIARSAHAYGLSDFFAVHPIHAQRELAERVREHWTTGSGARRIPDRSPALAILRVVPSLDAAIDALG
ncbi:MAG TPA: RNA methyltransferase, partial [Polyangiaceae bacterium]